MKPTVGRIVHFYTKDTTKQSNGAGEGPYLALVTQVFGTPGHESMANLKVTPPFAPAYDQGSVYEKAEAEANGHVGPGAMWWEWPPRA